MRSPLSYIGGKNRLAKRLIEIFPEHTTYVEAFAGGAQVFFHKEPSDVEALNDLDGEIANFYRVCSTKVLVLFSDMRHSMPDLNLESPSRLPSFSDAQKRAHILTADLQRTRAYSLGVDGAGKDLMYWEHLRQFWTEYFRDAGADLLCFSVLRDPPDFLGSER